MFERDRDAKKNERATGSDDDDDDIDTKTNDVGEKDIARLEPEQRVGVFTSAIRSAVDTRRAARGKKGNTLFTNAFPRKRKENEFLSRFWSSFRGSARFSPFQAHLTLLLSFFCPTEPTNTNRAARHLRTRMITCSSGRRRFVARKTPRGKAGFFPYG